MPTYPEITTYVSGFYNNKVTSGVNDRVYTARDMRMPYSAIFSDGVKPNANGVLGTDLRVVSATGLNVSVSAGQGMFGGAFFKNNSAYTITLDTGTSSVRYDCIVVKADDSEDVRATTIYVKSLNRVPQASDFTRTDDVKEYCLAYVAVGVLATSVTQTNITDCRLNQNLCGVITGVYRQLDGAAIAAQWESAFYDWFNGVKDVFVSNATLIHHYYNTTVSTVENQTRIPIGISQYESLTDVLLVMVEGRVLTAESDYTIYGNTHIDLAIALPVVGTRVMFEVMKSVNGSGAQSVVSQVNTLINQMNVVSGKLEYDYKCSSNDNINISALAQAFMNNTGAFVNVADDAQLTIKVHGNMSITSAYSGAGTEGNKYVWFALGGTVAKKKRLFVDFSECSKIIVPLHGNTSNVIFAGQDVRIIRANVKANCSATGCAIEVFNGIVGEVYAENCYFESITTGIPVISQSGTFINCEAYISNSSNHAYCFVMNSAARPIVVVGGRYRAYTASGITTDIAAIVYAASGQANAVCILNGVNCPTEAMPSYHQKSCLNVSSGNITSVGLISALPNITAGATTSMTGTIIISKP